MSVFEKLWKRPDAAMESTLVAMDGERAIPPLRKARPFQNRMQSVGIFFIVAGMAAFILWHQWQKQSQIAEEEKKAAENTSTKTISQAPAGFKWDDVNRMLDKPKPKSDPTPPPTPAQVPPIDVHPSGNAPQPMRTAGGKREKTPEELWRDRRLSAAVLSNASADSAGLPAATPAVATLGSGQSAGGLGGQAGAQDELGNRLQAAATPGASAQFLPDRNFLITKGTMADCVLETRLVSTVPGMTRCVLSRDLYSDNGKVMLLERGSVLTGQYRSQDMRQGVKRIFVLWDRAKTPNGVIINLASPGADPLGGSGLEGEVETHFWERFGGAILISLIDDLAFALATRQDGISGSNNTVVGFPNTQAASQRMAEEALKASINIPPTLYKNQGDQIMVYVSRDLDFSTVYALKMKGK